MTMKHSSDPSSIRREYGNLALNDQDLPNTPFILFQNWFSEVLNTETHDPTAMVLSTVDKFGYPDSRVVLLKHFDERSFVFYTNYTSAKSDQIKSHPYVALNFYWPELVRQVRIRGRIELISLSESDVYFASRPRESQLSAIASPQSQVISNREQLSQILETVKHTYQNKPIQRPDYWGGYAVVPEQFEFWQGRDNRFHDRIQYYQDENQTWLHCRLAP